MKIIAAMMACFDRGPLGTASRLGADLLGQPVLRRTLRQVLAARRVDGVHLLVRPEHEAAAREWVGDLPVRVETHLAGPVPWQDATRVARAWAQDGWRGGLGNAYLLDETLNPWLLGALCQREQAQGIMDVPAAAVLLDPVLLDEMIAHYERVHADARLTFTQVAPGLAAAIYAPSLLADLAKAAHPLGISLGYRVGVSGRDSMMLEYCYSTPAEEIRRAFGRCLADTAAGFERARAILATAGGGRTPQEVPNASAVSHWLNEHRHDACAHFPEEVEIELTTDDPLPDSRVRPRGAALERHGTMDAAPLERLLGDLGGRDDVRIVLGGFGDPLLHPAWDRCVAACRNAGALSVALRTPAVNLDDAAIERLLDGPVDVLNVLLDAHSAEAYRQVHGADHFERVLANLDRLLEARQARKQRLPWLVCEMAKTHAAMNELEAFHDYWTTRTGAAVLLGPSTYGGQWPDLAVMNMAPASRRRCERLFSRALVLSDGRMTVCDQDYQGRWTVGSLAEHGLNDLWTHARMHEVRSSHIQGRFDGYPLCPPCQEWHRP